MENGSRKNKFLRCIYQHVILRFIGEVRDPYLIRIDNVFTHPESNELSVAFHIANKRVNQEMSIAEFVKTDMIYLVDPRIVFDIGQHFGAYSEKLIRQKEQPSLKENASLV